MKVLPALTASLLLLASGAGSARPGDVDPASAATPMWMPWYVRILQWPDGRYVLTERDSAFSDRQPRLFAMNAAGQQDLGFGLSGRLPMTTPPGSRWVEAHAIAPDGRILASSVRAGFNEVLRLNADGTPDSSFADAGRLRLERPDMWTARSGYRVERIAVRPDGSVLILEMPWDCEQWWDSGCYYRTGLGWLRQLLPDGSPDTTWGTNGVVELATFAPPVIRPHQGTPGMSLPLRPDGSLVVIGTDGELRIIPADGRGVRTVTTGVRTNISTLLPDGSMLLGGDVNDASEIQIVRLRPDGSVDTSFGDSNGRARIMPLPHLVSAGERAYLDLLDMAASRDGRYVYASFQLQNVRPTAGNDYRMVVLARLTAAGIPDAQFGQQGQSALTYGSGSDSSLVVTGSDVPLVAVRGRMLRVITDASPSRGHVQSMATFTQPQFSETAGVIRLTVSRLAGSAGEVRVRVLGVQPGPEGPAAMPGEDYVLRTTSLIWPDGDTGDKVIEVEMKADAASEPNSEGAQIQLVPDDGAGSGGTQTIPFSIADARFVSSSSGADAGAGNTSGGGALGGAALLGLLALLATRRASATAGSSARPPWRRVRAASPDDRRAPRCP